MDFTKKKILIVGMGKSGMACARFLHRQGALIHIYDKKTERKLKKEVEILKDIDITYYFSIEPDISKNTFDLLIVSPGVPLDINLISSAMENEIPIWGELELAYRFSKALIIAVTGTNGKTTTTSLIGKILNDSGKDVKVAGNIGTPFIEEIEKLKESSTAVVEVSSFQLETIDKFKPKIAVLLNITPDHLDRHKNIENYSSIKSKIFENQNDSDYAVLNYDDIIVRKMISKIQSNAIFFSQKHKLNKGVFLEGNKIKYNWAGQSGCIISWEECQLRGIHNIENVMAAVATALILNIEKEIIWQVLKDFKGVPHRLEVVGNIKGVTYVNDSKGTNPSSTIKAIEAYADKDIILIAGGMDKGSSFDELAKISKEMNVTLVVFGETTELIIKSAEHYNIASAYKVRNLAEAVSKAADIASVGSVVLLSPACASWDMYKSFEERGEHFKKLVKEIME